MKTNQNMAVKAVEAAEIKPVYTDVQNSEMILHDLVTEDQGDVLSNTSHVVITPAEEPVESQDEFIVPVQKEEIEVKEAKEPDRVLSTSAPVEKTEQLFKEIKEDKSKPREIKNPIEAVDLMNFFRSG